MTNTNDTIKNAGAVNAIHPWERAGLGIYPYKFVGYSKELYQACPGAPIQAGTSCDYCGTAIADVYSWRSADGRTFKVGSDCTARGFIIPDAQTAAERALARDPEFQRMRRAERDAKRAATQARQDAKIDAACALLADERVRAALASKPHPVKFRTDRGETLLDSLEWYMDNAGRAGKVRAAKMIQAAAGEVQ